MILGIVGNPPSRSESRELETAILDLEHALFAFERSYDAEVADDIARAKQRLTALRDQVRAGVHTNPGRQQAGGMKMSGHVQAIIYTHEDDNQFYCHGFGDAEIRLTTRGQSLHIDGLKDRTNVEMLAMSNGSICIIGRSGQRLWEDIH